MDFQVRVLSFLFLTITSSLGTPSPIPSPSPSPSPLPLPSPSPAGPLSPVSRPGHYPSGNRAPVYVAQRLREESAHREDDDPYSPYPPIGVAQTSHGVEEEPENTGFVEPIDFKNLLREVEETSAKGLGEAAQTNPLFAQESKNAFSGFFSGSDRDPFDFQATASSERRAQNNPSSGDEGEGTGFVDPNVQFRSLFDSAQTASSGFKPEDFLANQDTPQQQQGRTERAQTQAFPSFTYTGRRPDGSGDRDRGDDRGDRYRSSYRQVNNGNDYSDNYRDDDNNGGRGGGGRDYYEDSPPQRSQQQSPRRYNSNERPTPRNSPISSQETSNRPQTSASSSRSSSPKSSSDSKNSKCKKIEKTVDYENEDSFGYTEPEPDYDPSTYSGRYKRQSSRQGSNSRQSGRGSKRPMTCYVCEDEEGRYAERCSYDSKADPKKGEYFHSSSSSYRDDGKGRGGNQGGGGRSGKSDRHRRNPYVSRRSSSSGGRGIEAAPTTTSSLTLLPDKVIEKRQSGGFTPIPSPQGAYRRNTNTVPNPVTNTNTVLRNNARQFDVGGPPPSPGAGGPSYPDFSLPRGYIGNTNPGGEGGRGDFENNSPQENSGNGPSDFGFNQNDFNFGPPADFGGERGANSPGGDYDFTIPRDFDPDVQLTRNRGSSFNSPGGDFGGSSGGPSYGGPSSSNSPGGGGPFGPGGPDRSANDRDVTPNPTEFGIRNPNFDEGYEDYVKRHFPENFGAPSAPGDENEGDGDEGEGGRGRRPRPSRREGAPFGEGFQPGGPPPPHINHSPSYRPLPLNFNNNEGEGPSSHSPQDDDNDDNNNNNFSPPPNFYTPEERELTNLVQNFPFEGQGGQGHGVERPSHTNLNNNLNGPGCRRVVKGDMTCRICKDNRGMNKEECMYANNDPKNPKMAYHEVTEYSSDPPASILPPPNKVKVIPAINLPAAAASVISAKIVKPDSDRNKSKKGSITKIESTFITRKIHHENKSPSEEFDFDY